MRMHPYLHVQYVPLSASSVYQHQHHQHHHHHHHPAAAAALLQQQQQHHHQHHHQQHQQLQHHHHQLNAAGDMKVSWATVPNYVPKADTSKHFHIFIGDVSQDLDHQQLRDAFSRFGDISDCKIIRDPVTQKSKGYGFVSFVNKLDAEQAIMTMNGQWLGSRPIRTNWATRRPLPQMSAKDGGKPLSYDEVYNQSSDSNCTVYCGGITKGLSEELMRSTFQQFGTIREVRIFKDKGFAFVRFGSKESATKAICGVHGTTVSEQVVKCSWGKESNDSGSGFMPTLAAGPMAAGTAAVYAAGGGLYSVGGGGGGGSPYYGTAPYPSAHATPIISPTHPAYLSAAAAAAAAAGVGAGGGGVGGCGSGGVSPWASSTAAGLPTCQLYGSLAGVQWGQTVNPLDAQSLSQQTGLVAYPVQPGFLG